MRLNNSRLGYICVAWMMIFIIMVGCGSEGNPEGSGEVESKVDQGEGQPDKENKGNETSDPEPAEITFYSHSGLAEEQFNNRYGDQLRKKFPHFTINYIRRTDLATGIAEMVASKTPFDIYFANVGSFENEAIQYGLQMDMSELIKKHDVDMNVFDPSVISGVKSSNHGIYALPIHSDTMVTYYNKEIFEKFGVDYPENGMLWDDVYALSKKLTRKDGDTQYIGYAPFSIYMLYMNPLSIPVVDEITEMPTINKDDRWRNFFQTLLIAPTEAPEVREYLDELKKNKSHIVNAFMKDRTAAMLAYVSALAPTWPDEMAAFDWDWVSVPTLKEQPEIGAQPYTFYFGITNIANNQDAAMEALKYMVSEEFQLALAKQGYLPVIQNNDVKQVLGQETMFKDKNWQAMFYHKLAPVPVKGVFENRVAGIYNTFAEQLMSGALDLNTALLKAEENAMMKLDEWRQ